MKMNKKYTETLGKNERKKNWNVHSMHSFLIHFIARAAHSLFNQIKIK